jgi:uncharacterized damage-inducible protein DinB
MNALDRFRRMQGYEKWANELTIEAVGSCQRGLLSQASRIGAAPELIHEKYTRAMAIMGHILWARRRWLWRLGGCEPPPREMPTDEWPSARLIGESHQLDDLWQRYLAGLELPDLERTVHYHASDGREHADSVGDIITHQFNHSTYHRGQVAMLVKQCGGDSAETDYILFVRQTTAATRT